MSGIDALLFVVRWLCEPGFFLRVGTFLRDIGAGVGKRWKRRYGESPLPSLAIFGSAVLTAASSLQAFANEPAEREMTLDEFLVEVVTTNLNYAAQRYGVDLAKADAAAAKLWPNPTLSFGASRDLTFHGKTALDDGGNRVSQTMPENHSVGLTQTLDLAGKRRWRIRTAEQTYRAAAATLEDFLRNLRIDAAEAFVEALATRSVVVQQREAVGYLKELANAQRVRFEKGDISEADSIQAQLERVQLENDLRQSEAAATGAQLALSTFLGREAASVTISPRGELTLPSGSYDPDELVAQALANRPDLAALRHARDAADTGVSGAKAERFPDVDFGATFTTSRASDNFVAPSPRFNQLDVGVSLPLPLWNRNQHEVRKAQASASQAARQLEAAELKTAVQVRTAYANYQAAEVRVRQYQGELLRGAQTVLAARRYSYEHGQTSLLELLDAERTATQLQQSFHDALADAAKAHLELLRAAALTEIPLTAGTK